MKYCSVLIVATVTFLSQGCSSLREASSEVSLRRVHSVYKSGVDANVIAFLGVANAPIHRPAPEHFKLVILDGSNTQTQLKFSYEASSFGLNPRRVRSIYCYNFSWKGVRFFVGTGQRYRRFMEGGHGILNLYSEAELKPGQPYRLTWACWPVGAEKAVEQSVDFVWKPTTRAQQNTSTPSGAD